MSVKYFLTLTLALTLTLKIMKKISDIIGKRMEAHKIGSEASAAEIIFRVNQYLKKWLELESNEVKAVFLRGDILWLEAASATWAQEANGIQQRLLSEIQDKYGEKRVTKVRIKSLTTR